MPVAIHQAQYIKSAPSLRDCPVFEDGTTRVPEIALVGRSNVGKSSLINSLLGRKNLARTSNTPGKTRLINFYKVDYKPDEPDTASSPLQTLVFVDLPGYGYAKVSQKEQLQWRKNLETFLLKREPLQLVLQLIDSRHGMLENDLQMAEWLHYHHRPTLCILTKMDKLSRNEQAKQLTACRKQIPNQPVLPYSAETHLERETLWESILLHG